MNKIDKAFRLLVTLWVTAIIIVAIYNKVTWCDSIHNPVNDEYVVEVAFNLGIEPYEVTQRQFNDRYGK